MGNPLPKPGMFVSLQAPTDGPSATDAHRAPGTLLAADLVLVPALPRRFVEEVHTYHVLLAGLPEEDGRAVERIGLAYLEAHGVDAPDGDVALVIELARPSLLRVETGQTCSSRQLTEGLRAHGGDLRAALAGLGAAGSGDARDPAEALRGIGNHAISPAPRPARVILHGNLDDVARSICWWVPWCHPHWPGEEPP
jgi:hypothetical protein